MKFLSTSFILFLCLCGTLVDSSAAENTRLSYAVICDDPALTSAVNTGIRSRLANAKIDVSDKYPAGKLFLYLQRDVNDERNRNGVSVAIAHVSNLQTASLALGLLNKKEPISEQLSSMLREEGFLKHLSVAHMDVASDEQINILLDSVVKTFVSKYQNSVVPAP